VEEPGIYSSTRSLGAAIAAHFGVDTVHSLFFTYPALAWRGLIVEPTNRELRMRAPPSRDG